MQADLSLFAQKSYIPVLISHIHTHVRFFPLLKLSSYKCPCVTVANRRTCLVQQCENKYILNDGCCCGLPCSWRMVWCGLQCTAPMAFPAQLFHRPWRTQVAVMTEDARLVALHSLDTVAPIVAPSPARPLMRARICRADIWSFTIFLSKFKKKKRNENCCRLTNYTVDMCFIEMIYRQDISRGQ